MLPRLLKSDSFFGIRVTSGLFGYDVVKRIGSGARSAIYLVRKPGSTTLYTLKHVVLKEKKDVRYFEQLQTEYRVGQLVTAPGLRKSLQIHAYRTVLHQPVEAGLLLEYVDGMPLDQANLGIASVVSCFTQAARAIHAMHIARFVHCDIKPGNILIRPDGSVTVIDLGQACPFGTVKPRIQGTPDFISPEQVHCKPVGIPADVFGLGACMYWALSHKALPTLFTLKREKNSFLLDDTFPEPRQLNPLVPPMLSQLVMDCVRTNPEKRPVSALDVSQRLEAVGYAMQQAHAKRVAGQ